MKQPVLSIRTCSIVGVSLVATAFSFVYAQAPAGQGRGGRGGGGGFFGPLFAAMDANKDGSVSRDEMKAGFDSLFTKWDSANGGALTSEQTSAGATALFAAPPPAPGAMNTFNAAGNTTPLVAPQADIDAMMAALPTTPGAKPAKARKVLVYAHTGAGGFVHSSIPLAAKTVEALGNKGNLWTTTVSYDPKDITAANLKQYDAVFLDSNTACFLDDADPKVTAQRRADFLDFIRSGKGIAGIHAATDNYHTDCVAAFTAARNGNGGGMGAMIGSGLANQLLAQGDGNGDQKLSRAEFATVADAWYEKLDTEKAGKVSQADFNTRFTSILGSAAPGRAGRGGGRGRGAEPAPILQWPEWNKIIGGYFKFHWVDPQLIITKIDDPKSPLTAMFKGQEFEIRDETYTFAQDSFSRTNVHVLTSINFDKMSAEDKAKESNPRTDGDYALSYIRAEGKGRVFYEAHGHSPRVYAMTPMLEHIRAGIQYAIGDLKADDSPSKK